MAIFEKISDGGHGIKQSLDDKIYQARSAAEFQALHKFYMNICKEDGVTYDEAKALCDTDPKYSLGRKMQIYMIRASLDPRHMKQHKREMLALLSDEERKIYDEEVVPLKMGKMVKDEVKRQYAERKGKK